MKAKSPQMGLSQPLLLYTEAQKSNFHKRKSSFLQWELLDDFFWVLASARTTGKGTFFYRKIEKMKKNRENSKMRDLRRFLRVLSSHAKSSTISRVCRCCCISFRRNPRRFPSFSGMCVFQENQQPIWGGLREEHA